MADFPCREDFPDGYVYLPTYTTTSAVPGLPWAPAPTPMRTPMPLPADPRPAGLTPPRDASPVVEAARALLEVDTTDEVAYLAAFLGLDLAVARHDDAPGPAPGPSPLSEIIALPEPQKVGALAAVCQRVAEATDNPADAAALEEAGFYLRAMRRFLVNMKEPTDGN